MCCFGFLDRNLWRFSLEFTRFHHADTRLRTLFAALNFGFWTGGETKKSGYPASQPPAWVYSLRHDSTIGMSHPSKSRVRSSTLHAAICNGNTILVSTTYNATTTFISPRCILCSLEVLHFQWTWQRTLTVPHFTSKNVSPSNRRLFRWLTWKSCSASVDELLNREVCQWYFHVSHSDRRVLQDDDELSDDDESGEGDDGRDIDIRLSTLLQSVDVDVLRTSFNDPFTVSINRRGLCSRRKNINDVTGLFCK